MNDKDLDQMFQESFNKKPQEIFKEFVRKPIAAASIGQVHEAWLQTGEKVAVKVQYPKIKSAIESDLKTWIKLSLFYSLFSKHA